MSISASINITVGSELSTKKIIKIFTSHGWSLIEDGKTTYLPLNDDMFDWKSEEISLDLLWNIINQKEKSGELIGIIMWWKKTKIGITILIHSDFSLNISFDVNRKKINPSDITDVSWYLERIIFPLQNNGCIIESFSFEQYN